MEKLNMHKGNYLLSLVHSFSCSLVYIQTFDIISQQHRLQLLRIFCCLETVFVQIDTNQSKIRMGMRINK